MHYTRLHLEIHRSNSLLTVSYVFRKFKYFELKWLICVQGHLFVTILSRILSLFRPLFYSFISTAFVVQ